MTGKTLAQRPMVAFTALAIIAVLGGCSQGREYAVPNRVCGVPVEESAIAPFLPDGENVRETHGGNGTSDTGCVVSVDDTIAALSLYQAYVEKLYDPMAELESYKFTHRKPIDSLPFSGKGAVGDENVMISTKCESDEVDYLIVDIRASDEVLTDADQRRAHMVEFAKEIVPNIKKHINCTAKK